MTDALGQATSIQRDLLGRPTLITYADDANSATARTTTITYDTAGYAKVITDPAAKTTYIRDSLGRVTRKTQLLSSGDNRVVNYTYVAAGTAANVGGGGQLNSMSYPNGGILSYVYSSSGQLSGLNWQTASTAAALPLISNITWSPLGQPLTWNWDFADAPGATIPLGTASIPTTQTAARTFDTAGRMTANEFASYTVSVPRTHLVRIATMY